MNGLNLDDSFYEWIYGYELADMDKITEKLSPKEKAKKKILGSDVGLSCDWKVPIKNEWEPWYPTIVEGSYFIISYYVDEKKKMFFSAKFTFDKVGVYNFFIPDMKDDVVYDVTPCYYTYLIKTTQPQAVDKSRTWSFTSPTLSVTRVKPGDVCITKDPEGFSDEYYDKEGNRYEYEYLWWLTTYTAVRGTAHIKNWWVDETWSGSRNDSDVGIQLGDGTYLMDWFFKVYSHKYDPKRELPLCFEPVFILNSDKREIIHKGSAYKLIVCADRRVYDGADYLSDPGEWYKFTPANTVTDPDKKTFLNADGDRVVVQMKRMEKIGDL